MSFPSPNILLALLIISFSLSAIFHRAVQPSGPAPPNVFNPYAADILVPSTNDTFLSRPAAFGPVFEDAVSGVLTTSWDGLACQPLAINHESPYKGKIVLVQRGKCSFADKVRRVQEVGGIAVIVGDNVPTSGDTSDIYIPSTFISHPSCVSLSILLSSSATLDVLILPTMASDWPLLDTLLLVVLSPLFTLACIYFILLIRRRIQRKRELAPLSLVKSLPKRKWAKEKDRPAIQNTAATIAEGDSNQPRRPATQECVICLEDFADGDIVLTLPCNHEFHEQCITPWLTTRRRLCPICKRDIVSTEEVNEQSPLLANENSPRGRDWRGDTAASV